MLVTTFIGPGMLDNIKNKSDILRYMQVNCLRRYVRASEAVYSQTLFRKK